MKFFEVLVHGRLAEALGWTIVHSLWQGAIIALALAALLTLARSSRIRYTAACSAMLAMLFAAVITFVRVLPQNGPPTILGARNGVPSEDAANGNSTPPSSPLERWKDVPPWMAPFWMTGVLLFYSRQLADWRAVRRLRRVGLCAPPPAWQKRVEELGARLRISRPVVLLESCLADVPSVVGHVRPLILMPAGLLTGLPAGQVEAILLHELAHVSRCDYLINLLQVSAEGLLFYHPAIWWISRIVREEREHCCDDLVVGIRGEVREYAEALTALELKRRRALEIAVAATGGRLVNRIRRLLLGTQKPRTGALPLLAVSGLMVVTALALFAWQERPPAPPQQPREITPYTKWLDEEAVYIITDEERAAFERLTTDAERNRFIEQFWLRRDPTPGTPQNEYRDEHYRRIAYANNRFGTPTVAGWKTDRGRIYILYGPPDELDAHGAQTIQRPPEQGGGTTQVFPFERWRYRFIEGIGNDVAIEFVDRDGTGDFRMTTDPNRRN
jgi:GWxTD domain-containing protein